MESPVSERVLASARALLEILTVLAKADRLVLTPSAAQRLRDRWDAQGKDPIQVFRERQLGEEIRRVELLISICEGNVHQDPVNALSTCLERLDQVLDTAPLVLKISEEFAGRLEQAQALGNQLAEFGKWLSSSASRRPTRQATSTVMRHSHPELQHAFEQIRSDRERYISSLVEIRQTITIFGTAAQQRESLNFETLRPRAIKEIRLEQYYWPFFVQTLGTIIRAQKSVFDGIKLYIDSLITAVRNRRLDLQTLAEASRCTAGYNTEDVLDEPRLSGYNLFFIASVMDQVFPQNRLAGEIEERAARHLAIGRALSRYRKSVS
jgi:hypothetical protein